MKNILAIFYLLVILILNGCASSSSGGAQTPIKKTEPIVSIKGGNGFPVVKDGLKNPAYTTAFNLFKKLKEQNNQEYQTQYNKIDQQYKNDQQQYKKKQKDYEEAIRKQKSKNFWSAFFAPLTLGASLVAYDGSTIRPPQQPIPPKYPQRGEFEDNFNYRPLEKNFSTLPLMYYENNYQWQVVKEEEKSKFRIDGYDVVDLSKQLVELRLEMKSLGRSIQSSGGELEVIAWQKIEGTDKFEQVSNAKSSTHTLVKNPIFEVEFKPNTNQADPSKIDYTQGYFIVTPLSVGEGVVRIKKGDKVKDGSGCFVIYIKEQNESSTNLNVQVDITS